MVAFFYSEDFDQEMKVEEVFIKSEDEDTYYAEKPCQPEYMFLDSI